MTRLDRLARSTRDLLNTLAQIADKGAGFRSLGDAWADTTTPHGRLMLTVLGRACRVRARVDPRPHGRRPRARQGARRSHGATAEAHPAPEERGDQAPRRGRADARDCAHVQCLAQHDFETSRPGISTPLARRVERHMPIRPQFKWLYPIDWPQLSAVIRFQRAKGRCEECGRPHGREVQHLGDGRWWDDDKQTWRNGRGRPLRGIAPICEHVVVLKNQGRAGDCSP